MMRDDRQKKKKNSCGPSEDRDLAFGKQCHRQITQRLHEIVSRLTI